MAYKTDKLQARIIEKFGTYAAFARTIGMDKGTLSRLISEGKDWKGSKLIEAVKALDIPESEINSYFFEPKVVKKQPKRAKV